VRGLLRFFRAGSARTTLGSLARRFIQRTLAARPAASNQAAPYKANQGCRTSVSVRCRT